MNEQMNERTDGQARFLRSHPMNRVTKKHTFVRDFKKLNCESFINDYNSNAWGAIIDGSLNCLCIQLLAELNAFNGGSLTTTLRGLETILTTGREFKLLQDKGTSFGYGETKFQTSN